MILNNDQIFTLGNGGFGKINYANLETEHALSVYKLRRAVVKQYNELCAMRGEIMADAWADKDVAARVAEYQKTGGGMTKEEYDAAVAQATGKATRMLLAIGEEKHDIDVAPIPFAAWLQLLKDNANLVGMEEILAGFIEE